MSRLTDCQNKLKTVQADLAACKTASAAKDQEIADLNTKLSAQKVANTNLQTQNDGLVAERNELKVQQAALEKQVADLQVELQACKDAANPNPPPDNFEQVPAGANLQDVLRQAGPGAHLQLPAKLVLTGTVVPLDGQYLRGPCVITPANPGIGLGFNCSSSGVEDVTWEKLDVSGFAKRGIQPFFGCTLKFVHTHHNGEMGVGFDGKGGDGTVFTMIDCETDHNGDVSLLGHGASGVKLFHVKRSKFVRLNTHENVGNGWWCDAECGYAEILGGGSWGNWRKAYFWEKCGGNHGAGVRNSDGQPYDGMLTIDGVNARDNNKDGGTGHAGVYIVASKNAVVKNSTFGGNDGYGITVRNDPARVADDHPGWPVSNVEISDSTNTMNGDKVTIGSDVGNGVRRT